MRRGRMILIPLIILTLLAFSAGAGFLATHPGALNRLGLNIQSAFSPAPLCGDGDCEGKDPYQTQCNTASGPGQNDAAFVANQVGVYDHSGHKLLVVQNWYSPKCQTNWALAYIMYPDELVSLSINQVEGNGLDRGPAIQYCLPTDCTLRIYGGIPAQPIYTLMTVAPYPITACATGQALSIYDVSFSNNLNTPHWGYSNMTCA